MAYEKNLQIVIDSIEVGESHPNISIMGGMHRRLNAKNVDLSFVFVGGVRSVMAVDPSGRTVFVPLSACVVYGTPI